MTCIFAGNRHGCWTHHRCPHILRELVISTAGTLREDEYSLACRFSPQNGENAHSLRTVQYVYLAMSMVGVVINVGMAFATLPEIQQVTVADAKDVNNVKGFMKKYHTLFGFAAEFAYVRLSFDRGNDFRLSVQR
jgi:fucose permease